MSWRKSTILLLLIVQSFNSSAQYKLILKGERSPYDSGVVIRLSTYRHEGEKMKQADQLIQSLKYENEILRENILYSDSVNKAQAVSVLRLVKSNTDKDIRLDKVSNNVKEIHAIATKPKKWYEKPKTWLIAFALYETIKIFIPR